MDELERILSGEDSETTPPAGEVPKEPSQEEIQKDNEAKVKAEQLNNLNKAIVEAQGKLRELRKVKKVQPSLEEEEIPRINMDDPSARAWDKHIRENVAPLQADMDKERDEVRNFALKEFLSDKPALARNPEKVKELMENYERLRTASERTREGVLLDLEKSYAATFSNELLNAARNQRFEQAKNDILFSDAAVSRGSTAYASPKEEPIRLTDEEKAILSKWGMTPAEWMEDKKKADKAKVQ